MTRNERSTAAKWVAAHALMAGVACLFAFVKHDPWLFGIAAAFVFFGTGGVATNFIHDPREEEGQ